VLNAKKILEEYGGVFLSDVVGLGKTYMAAMLASQLDGRTLVIAPPVLLDKTNPGSWPNVFLDFRISADFKSIGKLEEANDNIKTREYKNIIIDEAHRFRNEMNISYETLAEICRGKRVILVTATLSIILQKISSLKLSFFRMQGKVIFQTFLILKVFLTVFRKD
jgi:superfamily II DNA or RNA helicase